MCLFYFPVVYFWDALPSCQHDGCVKKNSKATERKKGKREKEWDLLLFCKKSKRHAFVEKPNAENIKEYYIYNKLIGGLSSTFFSFM